MANGELRMTKRGLDTIIRYSEFAIRHSSAVQWLYTTARRLVHPLVDTFLPVTYTAHRVRAKKRQLDPTGTRSRRQFRPESTARITGFADVLDCDEQRIESFLAEASRVECAPILGIDLPDFPSPMCWEDPYTLCVLTRAIAPDVAVETGIAHGISSAFILAAMEKADRGSLTSIETIDDDSRIGQAVPPRWRSRWKVRFGDSLAVLPDVLADFGRIDMFVHDSRHDYNPYTWDEFELAWRQLGPGGILCVHDILEANAFPRFVERHKRQIAAWAVGVNLGVIRKS